MNKRKFFRLAMKAELKSLGRPKSFYRKILKKNRWPVTLGNMCMLSLGLNPGS